MTVPLWAAILSLFVACVPPLQHALNEAEPLKAFRLFSLFCFDATITDMHDQSYQKRRKLFRSFDFDYLRSVFQLSGFMFLSKQNLTPSLLLSNLFRSVFLSSNFPTDHHRHLTSTPSHSIKPIQSTRFFLFNKIFNSWRN